MKNILIVEDDKALAEGIVLVLRQDGFSFQCCHNVKDAKKVLEKNIFDLILLDINLPDGSGLDICRGLRKEERLDPVIFLTALDTELHEVTGFQAGADDYITKPFDMEEVLARIESSLRRIQFQSAVPKRLQYKNLILDGEKNTVFLNGQELLLTAKELAILELLMRYPDKIFSKANLFQSIWDTEYLNEDNTLNVHISNLRNKMKELCPDEEYIDTVWGIGYRLHKAED